MSSLMRYEDPALVKERLGSSVYGLVVAYTGDPTLSEEVTHQRAVLNGFLASRRFSHMHIPCNLPLDRTRECLKELFCEVVDLANLDEVKPCLTNLAEKNLTVYGKIRLILESAKPYITYSFLYLFHYISSHNDAAKKFLNRWKVEQFPLMKADLCRDWMRQNPEELKKFKNLDLATESRLKSSPTRVMTLIPHEIAWLTELTSINLSAHPIFTLPKEIENLQKLERITLNGTVFKRLPEVLGKLKTVEKLEMQFCHRLEGIPEMIGDLPNLKILDLRFCEGLCELLGITFPEPKKPHFYSLKKVEQPPILPPFLEQLRKRGCDIKI
ncbi:MAG: leucine-rich repeat domain-containing protein [Chlamydiales bacterium]